MEQLRQSFGSNQQSAAPTMLMGAVGGVIIAYLFFTDRGRELCARAETALDTWTRDLARVSDSMRRVHQVYSEGRSALAGALDQTSLGRQ